MLAPFWSQEGEESCREEDAIYHNSLLPGKKRAVEIILFGCKLSGFSVALAEKLVLKCDDLVSWCGLKAVKKTRSAARLAALCSPQLCPDSRRRFTTRSCGGKQQLAPCNTSRFSPVSVAGWEDSELARWFIRARGGSNNITVVVPGVLFRATLPSVTDMLMLAC